MSGLPNTRFYLDDGTGTFPEDVTGLVKLEDGYQFTRGRGDVQSAPSAGTMNLTFNNGRPGFIGAFTPGSTVLRSPSVIALDTRIRVKEIINGSTYNRYTGYVKSWAVGWPDGVENTGVVRINCSDAQARAERRVLRGIDFEEITLDSPTFLYQLDESVGSTSAVDASGNQVAAATLVPNTGDPIITAPAAFGATVSTSIPHSAYQMNGNGLTAGPYTQYLLTGTVTDPLWTVCLVQGVLSGVTQRTVTNAGAIGSGIVLNANGQPIASSNAVTTSAVGVPSLADGNPHVLHFVKVVGGGGSVSLYVDGVFAATASGAVTNGGSVQIRVGDNRGEYRIAMLAGGGSALSAPRIAAQAQALLTAFNGETDNARLTRLGAYANIPVGTLDTSLTNVPFTDTTGRSAWDCIQEVADASMGVAYIDGSGNLVFHNRQKVTVKTTPDLTLSASFVTFDAEPTTDDQDLLNYMETTASATGVTQVVRDTVSESGDATHPAHGRYSDSKEYLVSTDDEARDRASWLVKTRAQPSTAGRYGTLTVNLYGMTAAQQSSVVSALEPGCWLRIVNMPTQTPGGTTVDLAVEGIAPSQSGNNWTIQCNVVSKSTLYPKVFILDSSLLDGPDLLGV